MMQQLNNVDDDDDNSVLHRNALILINKMVTYANIYNCIT